MWRRLYCFGLMLTAAAAWAESDLLSQSGAELTFERYGPEKGLPHNTVNDISQDSQGFLWFSTDDGLARFDGYTFRVFRPRPELAVSPRIHASFESRDGRLVVSGAESVLYFDRGSERFERVFRRASKPEEGAWGAWGTEEDTNGWLWLLSSNQLARMSPDGLGPVPVLVPGFSGTDGRASFARDSAGDLWLKVVSGWPDENRIRLFRLDGETVSFIAELRREEVDSGYGFFIDSRDQFWLGQDLEGQAVGSEYVADTSRMTPDYFLTAATEAPDGTIWVGTDAGLYRYSPDGAVDALAVDADRAWQHNRVTSLLVDSAGALWVGTLGGAYRSDGSPKAFRHLGAGLLSEGPVPVSGIQETTKGIWVGTFGEGLRLLDRSGELIGDWREGTEGWPCDDTIWSLFGSSTGGLWVGSDSGLCRSNNSSFELMEGVELAHLSFADPDEQELWIGIAGWGFQLREPESAAILANLRDPSAYPTAFAAMGSKTLWVGHSDDGILLEIDRSERKIKRHELREPGSTQRLIHVYDLAPKAPDALWLATSAGLASFQTTTGQFAFVEDLDDFPGSVAFSVVADAQDRLWIGTNRGLVRFDPKGTIGERTRVFGAADGVENLEFNRYSRLRRGNGEILMGGMSGLTAFHPDLVDKSSFVPPIVLTDVHVLSDDGDRQLTSYSMEGLTLDHKDRAVTFEFAALSFAAPEANRYSYRLEGIDPDWIDSADRRFARYTNLPAGSYTFRVRGSNHHGVWNEEGLALALRMRPPFWGTWWFRFLAVAITAALLAWAYRVRVRRLIEMERMRLRIATDLHDDLGSELSGIALASALVGRSASLSESERRRLSDVEASSRQVIEGLRDIVWYVNPEHDRFDSLVDRMRSTARRLSGDRDVTFKADVEQGTSELGMQARRQFFLVYKELLTNALRHSKGTDFNIALTRHDGILELTVEDNGVGFEEGATDGTGLTSVRRRAKRLGGQLELAVKDDGGTRATVTVPVT